MAKTPTVAEAEQAAGLLGVGVLELARALCTAAEASFGREIRRVSDFETPEFGKARALLRAAQACDAAWNEVADGARG